MTESFNSDDVHFMRRALELAAQGSSLGEVPVGAVVVSDGVIIGEGYNCPISTHDPTAHAEVVALRDAANKRANYRLLDCTLYVTIEPCMMCAGALIHSRITRVVFGAREPKAGAVISHLNVFSAAHVNHAIKYTEGVLADECAACISHFFRDRRQSV
jgi:tRNA(adenine34) deaminase